MPSLLDILDELSDDDNESISFDGSSPLKPHSPRRTQSTPTTSADELSYASGVVPTRRFPTPVTTAQKTYVRANGQTGRKSVKSKPQKARSVVKPKGIKNLEISRNDSMLVGKKLSRRWANDEKRTMLLLVAYYGNLTWTTVAQIMNAFFGANHRAPFRDNTVGAMYSELRSQKSARNAEIWTRTAIEIWQEHKDHDTVLRSLEQIARREKISLKKRAQADLERAVAETRRRKKKAAARVEKKFGRRQPQIVNLLSDSTEAEEDAIVEVKPDLANKGGHRASQAVGVAAQASQQITRSSRPKDPANVKAKSVAEKPLKSRLSASLEVEIPHLLFRTYNKSSSGLNTATLIRAGYYASDKYFLSQPIRVPPITLENQLFIDECSTHFHRINNKTHLISATSSLIWAFYRLLQQQAEDSNASILSIDGAAAHEATHVIAAEPIIKKLRKRNSWNPKHKYKGSCEYLIWGQVERTAITGCATCADLTRPSFGNIALQRFLQLDLIRNSVSVAALRSALAAQAKTLNLEIAIAVGELARRLGMTPSSGEQSITSMIFAILQGWVVRLYPGFLDDHEQVELVFDGFFLSFTRGIGHDALRALPRLVGELKRAWSNSVGKAHADVEKQFGAIGQE